MIGRLSEDRFSTEDVHILINKQAIEQGFSLTFRVTAARDCRLHWGLSASRAGVWRRPPQESWPPRSEPVDEHAVQTPLTRIAQDEQIAEIRLQGVSPRTVLPFVLFFPDDNRWLKDGRENFRILLPRSDNVQPPEQALADKTKDGNWLRHCFDVGEGETLAAAVGEEDAAVRIWLVTDVPAPVVLHWGLAERFRQQWTLPPRAGWPDGTTQFDGKAVRSPLVQRSGLCWLEIQVPKATQQPLPRGLNCLLYNPAEDRWIKNKGCDAYLPLAQQTGRDDPFASPTARNLADEIIGAETGKQSWTLMHRFNLCLRLLEGVENDLESLALLFVWLRYSAIRQLDWQRRYNTKPRELAHAQARLTLQLADIYRRFPGSRFWIRSTLGTLGRGGDGQRVRDEILHIMHRHHIAEAHGTFLEQWHQKLHNNTTPDDVVICEAYLTFLHSGGDVTQFYQKLEAGGVSRDRLRRLERPIETDPQFYAEKKDGLSHDFEQFLRVLKSVHSGADLDSAIGAARGLLDSTRNQQLDRLLALWHEEAPILEQVRATTDLREALHEQIASAGEEHVVRELVYLDLALEQALRLSIEQQVSSRLDDETVFSLAQLLLRNLSLSVHWEELQYCRRHLEKVLAMQRQGKDWALQAKAVSERLSATLAQWSKDLYRCLQPKAEFLGQAIGAEAWTIALFSEEIIRGSFGFALDQALKEMSTALRKRAGLGAWEIICPVRAVEGRMQFVESLLDIQGQSFLESRIIIAGTVTGEEEIPEKVRAIITSDMPDRMSHVAIRAREARILFASCFSTEVYQQLKQLHDRQVQMRTTPAGEIEWQETNATTETSQPGWVRQRAGEHVVRRRGFTSWLVSLVDFNDANVGGKSSRLQVVRRRLPDWIRTPHSMALPFGVFEAVLEAPENKRVAIELAAAEKRLVTEGRPVLEAIRAAILKLSAPQALRDGLSSAWQAHELPTVSWEEIWSAVKRVWASKWNDRAYYSRVALGIAHEDLAMAVLIQDVVEADYAFVAHTVNPLTGNDEELFAEVVVGMGETLVGNSPGRALSFTYRKSGGQINLLSYPSKREARHGKGVIFRSDSNGEDLEGFSGAGLYDSFLAQAPQSRILDYTDEPMVFDDDFRSRLLGAIGRVAIEVENTMGAPQDIEGAVQGDAVYVVQTRPQVGYGS